MALFITIHIKIFIIVATRVSSNTKVGCITYYNTHTSRDTTDSIKEQQSQYFLCADEQRVQGQRHLSPLVLNPTLFVFTTPLNKHSQSTVVTILASYLVNSF